MQAQALSDLAKRLNVGDFVKVTWHTDKAPVPVTWTGEVKSKESADICRVVYKESANSAQEYKFPPTEASVKVVEAKLVARDVLPSMEAGRLDITSSGIVPWQPLTYTDLLQGSPIQGRALLLSELKSYFGFFDRAEIRDDWLANDHERCTHGETLKAWINLIISLDSAQAQSPMIQNLIMPTILRLCALKKGENLKGEEKKAAMNSVQKAHLKLVFKDDPLSKCMMGSE
jgi:hypothetical protein